MRALVFRGPGEISLAEIEDPSPAVDEVVLRGESVRRLCNGGDVSPGVEFRRAPGTRVIAKNEEGRPIALVELKPDRRLWPLRVFRGT